MRIHLPVFVLTSILAAQNTTFVLPTIGSVVNGSLPFASGIGRYQQWYSPAALQSVMPGPERLLQVDFLAGQGVQTATTLDLEVAIGYSNPLGLTGTFDFNFVGPRVVVLSRRNVNLVTGAAGTAVLTFP
ncbi:MAG TPA: hypothetical protein VK348_09945, partial [Planctomycetota bacterium]|nr:hypothetical protein [Planctomycetota bacterium]